LIVTMCSSIDFKSNFCFINLLVFGASSVNALFMLYLLKQYLLN